MATFNYYLRDPKATKPTPIVLCINSNDKRKKIKTDQTITPKYWDFAKQKVKASYPGSVELNAFLSAYLVKAQKSFSESMMEGIDPSAHLLRERVQVKRAKSKDGIVENFNNYIESVKTIREPNTIKKIVSAFNHFKSFLSTKPEYRTFESINQTFYDQFLNYMYKTSGLNNNTSFKYIKVLKTYFQWTFDREIHNNTAFKRFKTKEFPVDVIYLNERELFSIYNLDLKFDRTLANVRDAFCFACFTGQRFSDVHKIKWEDIRFNSWILHTQKTKESIEVPLNRFAIEILRRYKDSPTPLRVLSIQKMNDLLKPIAKLAGIDETIKIVDYAGNQKKEMVYQKWELVTTHVARKTFVTLSLQRGMRPETVMEITGHKDFRTLKKYIKITSKVKELEMKEFWDSAVA